jgi:hypothetical protein
MDISEMERKYVSLAPLGIRVADHMHIYGLSFDEALNRAELEFAEEGRPIFVEEGAA